MSSNAVVVFREPRDVRIEERPIPDPAPDQVLIETSRTLVSTGTELARLVEADETYVTMDDRSFDYLLQ